MAQQTSFHAALSRRSFLRGVSATATTILLGVPGCGNFAPEDGAAFEPWSFPSNESRPEMLAVAGAILAASPHNTQPWLFEVEASEIRLFADTTRSLGAMDPLHREMVIGLGCALENLVIAARANGREADVTLFPDGDDPTFVARVGLTSANPVEQALYGSIPDRHTNRGRYLDNDAPPELESLVRAQLGTEDVHMTFLGQGPQKAQFARETLRGTRAIVGDHEMNEASHAWWRGTEDQIRRHRDGLTMDMQGLGRTTRLMGNVFSPNPDADTSGRYWIRNTEGAHSTCSAFVILSSRDVLDPVQQIAVGRTYQRLHLWATSVGLAMQPLNQLAELRDMEWMDEREPDFGAALAELVSDPQYLAQMIFRIGVPFNEASASPRRPLAWVTRGGES